MLDRLVTRSTKDTVPVTPVEAGKVEGWARRQPARTKHWVASTGFRADPGTLSLVPGDDGRLGRVLLGVPPRGSDAASGPWRFAVLPGALPAGRYAFDGLAKGDADDAALGWALGCYDFDRYRTRKADDAGGATLVWPEGADRAEVARLATGTRIVRDLINTPAGDLGPAELASAARDVGRKFGARTTVIRGDQLLAKGYPAVHAVGRAASRPPCLVDLRWGDDDAPKLTLVGKGVVFDSGGLDLKPSSAMLLMKKDMGGAAHVLGIAHAIMDAGLPVRLRVLVPAVENAVSGNAFRPLDVLETRKGLTVEVGNTDAEGRLILCDALAEADGESPDLLMDFATLTGAARIALGTDLPALFSNDDRFAAALLDAGLDAAEPFWRLPLHAPYRRQLDSRVADLSNVSPGRFGGAITAALFLQEFVSASTPWAHVDVMAWNGEQRPGRPVGGEAMGLRAAYRAFSRWFAGEAGGKGRRGRRRKRA